MSNEETEKNCIFGTARLGNQESLKLRPWHLKNTFRKTAIHFEPIQQLAIAIEQDFEYLNKCQNSLFCDWRNHCKPFGCDGAVKIF